MRSLLTLLAAAMILLTGCTFTGRKFNRSSTQLDLIDARLAEESRALTTAIVDTLSASADTNRHTKIALDFAMADQSIEGMPIERIDTEAIIAGQRRALAQLSRRLERQARLLEEKAEAEARLKESEERLLDMGRRYEAERNTSTLRRFWGWALGTFGAGGLIALAIFCPALFPLVGSLLSLVVSKLPSLVGWVGVVGRKTFDSVVKGVGRARAELRKAQEKGETLKAEEALALLDANLKISTDEDRDHGLIEARRKAFKI